MTESGSSSCECLRKTDRKSDAQIANIAGLEYILQSYLMCPNNKTSSLDGFQQPVRDFYVEYEKKLHVSVFCPCLLYL